MGPHSIQGAGTMASAIQNRLMHDGIVSTPVIALTGTTVMKVRELLSMWENTARGALTPEQFSVRLPVEDAAKIRALAEMYPRRSEQEIVTDLLSAALIELESSLPYQRGDRVVALDEEGDPLYEDVGPTPRFLNLIKKHLSQYRQPVKGTH
jgi:hypothetical protein